MFFRACKDISYPKKTLTLCLKLNLIVLVGSCYSAELIKGYKESIN
ncbi:hypothetical protein HPHPA4_0756 [Helicobacter pylori Hp A-4]|nr:hypothetical protein HPHPA4_0756 [Helicobacter pylori Hp A-4]